MAQTHTGNGAINEAMRHAAVKLSQDLSKTTKDAQDAAAEFAEAVLHSASDIGEEAATVARDTSRVVRQNVREHPMVWVSAAAGAGALIGLLLSRSTIRH